MPRLRARRARPRAAVRVRGRRACSASARRASSCSRTRCTWRCRASTGSPRARKLRLEDLARRGLGADLAARAPARATSCAAATPPASSRACRFESDDYQTVQGLVAAGVGVALIPQLALSVVREDIAIRALSPAPPVRSVIAATPAGARLVPAAAAMLGILEARLAELRSWSQRLTTRRRTEQRRKKGRPAFRPDAP